VLISFITASYNYEQYIKETIESVLNQTYKDWELIIVDDGSTDNSVKIIEEYRQKDGRIKLLRHENSENKGLIETLKLGLSNCSSEYVAFLESDDKITPDYLEKKVGIIEKYPEVNLIFNDVTLFGDEEKVEQYNREYFLRQKECLLKYTYPANIKQDFLSFGDCIIPTFSTVLVRKSLIENADFNSPVKSWTDYYLWAQIVGKGNFYYINEKLTFWRLHHGSYIGAKYSNTQRFLFEKKLYSFLLDDKPILRTIKILQKFFVNLRRDFVKIKFSEEKNCKELTLFNIFVIDIAKKN